MNYTDGWMQCTGTVNTTLAKWKKKCQLYFNLSFTLYEINYTAKNSATNRTLSTAYILTVFMSYIQSVSLWPQTEQYGNLKTEIINICIQ